MTPEEFAANAGIEFRDMRLLGRALTHRSFINENPDALEDNERLEFLGDATLDFLAGAWVYARFPEMDEGQLTRMRSSLVRTEQLAAFAGEIRIGEALRLGKGEESTGGRQRASLLCAAFEAVLGAIYLDSGLEAVRQFLEPRFQRAVEEILADESLVDPRSMLQIWAQAESGETPQYRMVDSFGPDHAREFIVEVFVGDAIQGRGQGRSKQEAAQRAAEDALRRVPPDSTVD